MTQKGLDDYCASKKGSSLEFPFKDEVAVYKVKNKMFALYGFENNILRLNVKCEPNDALAYREIYKSVIAGYHMNKKHWNTIIFDNTIEDNVIKDMIDESYDLVVNKLTKKQKEELNT